jgi:hypothetical protein
MIRVDSFTKENFTAKDRTPYTYSLLHKASGLRYFGARYSKDCLPSDLWKSYFTSSKHVAKLISISGVEAFHVKITRVFGSKAEAGRWENKLLNRVDAVKNPKMLNRHNGMGKNSWYDWYTTASKEELADWRKALEIHWQEVCTGNTFGLDWWKNLADIDREIHIAKIKIGQSRISDAARERRDTGMRNWLLSASDDNVRNYLDLLSRKQEERWKNTNEETRKSHGRAISKGRLNRPPQEVERVANNARNNWLLKSEEERNIHAQRSRLWYQFLSKEEREALQKRRIVPLDSKERQYQEKRCPYCRGLFKPMNFGRWHGDKCKDKPHDFL